MPRQPILRAVAAAVVAIWSWTAFAADDVWSPETGPGYDRIRPLILLGFEPYSSGPLEQDLKTLAEVPDFIDCASECRRNWGQVTGGVWLGGLAGHLQTPTGGRAGTTSSHRPTVDEIGLDGLEWMPVLDVRLELIENHEAHFSYTGIGRSGTDTLASPLISQGVPFPTGAPVQSNLGLDTFRFGYRPRFENWCWQGWRLSPEAGIGFAQFDYRLRSPAAPRTVDRAYNIAFPYVGCLLEKQLNERWLFETEIAGMGGINGISFIDNEFRLVYEISRCQRLRTSAVIGWRGMWLRRHDGQLAEQNDPNLRFGSLSGDPWTGLTIGLRLGF